MITIELNGGLGNQLFQIFTVIAFSLKHSKSFFFFNNYLLADKYRYTYWNTFLTALKPFLRDENQTQLVNNAFIYKELSFTYDSNIDNCTFENIVFAGYFQSYLYFEKYKNPIIKLLKIPDKLLMLKNKYYNIFNFHSNISMHFRIGDYKIVSHHHPILTDNYYINAINYIIQQTNNTYLQIIYFYETNDYNIIHERIRYFKRLYPNINFIDIYSLNNELSDWEQMLMMSLCKYNIMANSTFSWWGAYLNIHPDNIICYPSYWFGTALNHDTTDLFKPSWHKIIA
jgi:hypothetical protein